MDAGRRRHVTAAGRVAGRRRADWVQERASSPLHHEWVATVLGVSLGIAFALCFLTGIVDHLAQHPPSWFHLPTRPVNLYGINEAVHVLTGIASIPLLLAKLWTVWPRLFTWPPVRGLAHALERLSLLALVGGSLFQLFTGVANIDYWYSSMPFFFPTAHFWVAWLVVGGLVVHVGAKAPTAADALAVGPGSPASSVGTAAPSGGLTRRGFIGATFATGGLLVATVVGESVTPLRKLALLAPRNPTVGPASLPVNESAAQARVTAAALDPGYVLTVGGNCRMPRSFSLAALRRLPQRSAGLAITCTEGWIAPAQWRGVPLRTLLRLAGAAPDAAVRVESLEAQHRLYSSSVVDPAHIQDPDTLLALELNGRALDLDHGFPVRLIAPDRPGVEQTKWLARVIVL